MKTLQKLKKIPLDFNHFYVVTLLLHNQVKNAYIKKGGLITSLTYGINCRRFIWQEKSWILVCRRTLEVGLRKFTFEHKKYLFKSLLFNPGTLKPFSSTPYSMKSDLKIGNDFEGLYLGFFLKSNFCAGCHFSLWVGTCVNKTWSGSGLHFI